MNRKRIGRHIGEGPEEEAGERERREGRERLRAALARWATGVTLVAVREGARVHALTVSAFLPVSFEPEIVLVSLGPNAAARPYIDPGARMGISILAYEQRALATRYADTYPVGPDPFGPGDPPLVTDALATLDCVVDELLPRGDHMLVLARVVEARSREGDTPLVYHDRSYHRLD